MQPPTPQDTENRAIFVRIPRPPSKLPKGTFELSSRYLAFIPDWSTFSMLAAESPVEVVCADRSITSEELYVRLVALRILVLQKYLHVKNISKTAQECGIVDLECRIDDTPAPPRPKFSYKIKVCKSQRSKEGQYRTNTTSDKLNPFPWGNPSPPSFDRGMMMPRTSKKPTSGHRNVLHALQSQDIPPHCHRIPRIGQFDPQAKYVPKLSSPNRSQALD